MELYLNMVPSGFSLQLILTLLTIGGSILVAGINNYYRLSQAIY